MKLIRFEHGGEQGIGILEGDGIISIARHDSTLASLHTAIDLQNHPSLSRLRGKPADLNLSQVQLLPPLAAQSRIFLVGLNYKLHVEEGGHNVPEHPTLFIRTHESFVGHGQSLVRPSVSTHFDFEGELALMIGSPCHNVTEDQALSFIGGYMCCQEGSIRDYQKHSPTGMMGKNFDASGALGPWIVTADEIPDPTRLLLTTRLNGVEMQRSTTDLLIYPIRRLISYLSQAISLRPGDIISTGTPSGVGMARNPSVWMKPGDRIEVEISGVGVLRNDVVDAARPGGAA